MPLLLWILLLPILEIVGFVVVGDWIGAGPTILLLLLSAVVGTLLVRRQGLATLAGAQGALGRGEAPGEALFAGFCTVVAGILLIVPGFLTDLVGLTLLVPPVRRGLGYWLLSRLAGNGGFQVWTSSMRTDGPAGTARDPFRPPPGIIDGDYRDVTEQDPATPRLGESRWGESQRGGDRDEPGRPAGTDPRNRG